MPKFHTNPSHLTKDQLKKELTMEGISLPKSDQKKQAYVDLYLEHLTSQNDNDDSRMFSSDEEEEESKAQVI